MDYSVAISSSVITSTANAFGSWTYHHNRNEVKRLTWIYEYPHIPLLLSMKPTLRILLGQKLYWTEKRDGSNMAIWLRQNEYVKTKIEVQISSRNQESAAEDLVNLVKQCEEYPKILKLLEGNPEFVAYVEACREGRSVTGIEIYEKDFLVVFDIYNKALKKFLPYVLVHQHCFHYNIPVVKLWAETRHRTVKDLLKWKNHALEHCKAVGLEGMVIKAYKIPEKVGAYYREYAKGLMQAKVKLDVPEPKKRKISKGEPILPPIPDNEILGAIDKVLQDIGKEKFMDTRIAMPLIAQYVSEECRKHLYSQPKRKLFQLYQEFMERMI